MIRKILPTQDSGNGYLRRMFSLFFKKDGKILWQYLLPLLAGALIYIGFESTDRDDFYIFYSGAADLWKGEDIYGKIYNEYYHYLYSIFFALVLTPLVVLPFSIAKFLWLAVSLWAFWRSMTLMDRWWLKTLPEKKRRIVLLLTALISLRFVYENLHYGQITLLLLWMGLESLNLIAQKKTLQGSLLLAFACNIKLLNIVFIPYLIYRRKFRAAAWCMLFLGGMYIIPSLVIGHEKNTALMKTWWGMMNPGKEEHIRDTYDYSFHGLSTFFAVYLSDVPPGRVNVEAPRQLASLSTEQLNMILNISRGILILLTLLFLKWPPFKENLPESDHLSIAWISLLIPLIFPHQHHYSFYFALPALLWLALNRKFAWFALIFLLFGLQLFLGNWRDVYMHYKLVTWGALILAGVLCYYSVSSKRCPRPEKS